MSLGENNDLREYCLDVGRRARQASEELVQATGGQKNAWLRQSARLLRERAHAIHAANKQDVEAATEFGLSEAQIDRLHLTGERIDGIARALENVAALPDPVGEVMESSIRPNGLEVLKVRVPLGVVFFIYE